MNYLLTIRTLWGRTPTGNQLLTLSDSAKSARKISGMHDLSLNYDGIDNSIRTSLIQIQVAVARSKTRKFKIRSSSISLLYKPSTPITISNVL